MTIPFRLRPLNCEAGVVIGNERILTNISGAFGWGDGSHANVYVFDGQGNLAVSPDVVEVWNGDQLLDENSNSKRSQGYFGTNS